jgi:hypothetical protein
LRRRMSVVCCSWAGPPSGQGPVAVFAARGRAAYWVRLQIICLPARA